jgi:hypothetical protein
MITQPKPKRFRMLTTVEKMGPTQIQASAAAEARRGTSSSGVAKRWSTRRATAAKAAATGIHSGYLPPTHQDASGKKAETATA